MENKKQGLGVVLYHLKDKFAFGSTSGSELTEFKFDMNQVEAIREFLLSGAFQGMFDIVDFADYQNITDLNYISLAREAISSEEKKYFNDFRLTKIRELENMQKFVDSNQSQPE